MFLVLAAWLGQVQKTEIAVVSKDKMDTSKNLADLEKNGFVTFKTVLSREYEETFSNVLTKEDFMNNVNNVQLKNLKFPLESGQTISKSFLSTEKGGNLATSIPEKQTVYFFPNAADNPAANLPPDVAAGDKVDVVYTYQKKGEGNESYYVSKLLLQNAEVFSIAEAPVAGVYLKVTESDQLRLTNSSTSGKFSLRLPGLKETSACESAKEKAKRKTDSTFECYAPEDDSLESIDSLVIQQGDETTASKTDSTNEETDFTDSSNSGTEGTAKATE